MELEYDVSDFEKSKQQEQDNNLLVKFFYKTRPDNSATEAEGRPMFKEVVYVDIKIAGDRNSGVCRPARGADIERFKRHYDAFMNRVEAPTTGTPLSECVFISRTTIEELSYQNVKTVEQLATLSDDYAGRMHGGHGFKQKAQEFLEQAKKAKEFGTLASLERKNEELMESNNNLLKRLEALENKQAAEAAQVKPKKKNSPSKETLAKMAAGRAKAAEARKLAKKG